ncbi:MAG: methyltransferase domain-containing protein [Deltaproteobacteria bacterium]|jgi:SAM-dependent methyltransferase|nr:methyltransferase domain-containing protein [Deltaproteobacteria bacterium]
MPEPSKKSYRDYFISGGRHIGDYEGMYRDCEDPWRIEELGLRLDMSAALLLLEACPPVPSALAGCLRVLDAGAGAGLFSLALFRKLKELLPEPAKVELALNDISPTALKKAAERFGKEGEAIPSLFPFDLRLLAEGFGPPVALEPLEAGPPGNSRAAGSENPLGAGEGNRLAAGAKTRGIARDSYRSAGLSRSPAPGPLSARPAFPAGADSEPSPFAPESFDLVVLAQSLWGVVQEIGGVIAAFRRLLVPDGLLLISQHFPGPANQAWGREVTGPEGFAGILTGNSFTLMRELETDRSRNHHWGALWRRN